MSSNAIRAIEIDNNNTVWIGTSMHGLFKYENDVWTNYNESNSDIGNRSVSTLKLDNNNNLWIGFSYGGASKFDGTTFTNYNTTNGLPSDAVWAIDVDADNNIWFGTENGVAVFDGASSWIIRKIYNNSCS